jgi:hypothetical protein
MKHLLILIILLVTTVSCTNDPIPENIKIGSPAGQYLEIWVIDSCEYIYYDMGNASWGTHKGNCKYCKLRNK